MSYRQAYTELEGLYTTVVGTTTSGNTASFGANEIGTAEIGIGACSGNVIGSASVALQHLGLTSVDNTILANNSVSGTRVSTEYGPLFRGSGTPVGGNLVQVFQATTSAGSAGWFVFPRAFAGTPLVVALEQGTAVSQGPFVPAGSVNAGSFYVQSVNASSVLTIFACGSGR